MKIFVKKLTTKIRIYFVKLYTLIKTVHTKKVECRRFEIALPAGQLQGIKLF